MTSQSAAVKRLGGGVSVAVSGRQPSITALVLAQHVRLAQLSERAATGHATPH